VFIEDKYILFHTDQFRKAYWSCCRKILKKSAIQALSEKETNDLSTRFFNFAQQQCHNVGLFAKISDRLFSNLDALTESELKDTVAFSLGILSYCMEKYMQSLDDIVLLFPVIDKVDHLYNNLPTTLHISLCQEGAFQEIYEQVSQNLLNHQFKKDSIKISAIILNDPIITSPIPASVFERLAQNFMGAEMIQCSDSTLTIHLATGKKKFWILSSTLSILDCLDPSYISIMLLSGIFKHFGDSIVACIYKNYEMAILDDALIRNGAIDCFTVTKLCLLINTIDFYASFFKHLVRADHAASKQHQASKNLIALILDKLLILMQDRIKYYLKSMRNSVRRKSSISPSSTSANFASHSFRQGPEDASVFFMADVRELVLEVHRSINIITFYLSDSSFKQEVHLWLFNFAQLLSACLLQFISDFPSTKSKIVKELLQLDLINVNDFETRLLLCK
jgi:hypothetical protein